MYTPDSKLQLAKLIGTGKRLVNDDVQPDSRSGNAFMAVSAHYLAEYGGEQVTLENFDVGSISDRVMSLEGLFSKIFGGDKKAKKENPSDRYKRVAELMTWAQKELPKINNSSLDLTAGEITVRSEYAGFIPDKIKAADQLVELIAKDMIQYKAIFERYKGPVSKVDKWLGDVIDELDSFIGDPDNEDDEKRFEILLASLNASDSKITPVYRVFKEPTHNFLGYGDKSFTDIKSQGRFTSHSGGYPKAGPSSTVVPLTNKGWLQLKEVLSKGLTTSKTIYLYTDELHQGVDATDPPIRGFLGSDEVDNHVNVAMYLHPAYEEENTDVMYSIHNRVEQLCELSAYLLKKSIKV